MTKPVARTLELWRETVRPRVMVAGEGPPLIFFHGVGGLVWDDFLTVLSTRHTVYAPEFPGTSPGQSEAIKALDDWHDLTVYHAELIDALVDEPCLMVGHGLGGMIAAEVAAASPEKVSKLVLMAPLGLWRDDTPIPPWLSMNTGEVAEIMYHDQAIAWRHMLRDEDAMDDADRLLASTWAVACAGKFTWPIPDRGLAKRLHRVRAPTLLLWGAEDRLVAPSYATTFAAAIARTETVIIPNAGHALNHEAPEAAAHAIEAFQPLELQPSA